MKVALLPSAYAPAVGGVEELTRRLAARLVDRGDEVEVWTFRHPPSLAPVETVDGVVVRRFAFPLPAAAPRDVLRFPPAGFRALGALSEAARSFRPDVVHVQCFSAQGIYATALAARRRLPLIVSLQGETVMDDADIYERSLLLRLGLRAALHRAGAVTGCSRFVLDDAERRFGLSAAKGRVIHNGVEVGGDEKPEPLGLPFERFVLALGRVVAKKGFDLLVAAFAKVAAAHPDVGLVIGGDGAAHSALVALAGQFGVAERVVLPGRLDRSQVAWAMANAEVFVLPSRVEPFGIVVLEALRAGRPVVVSSHGGAPEIVRHEREGLVADPFDTEGLASAMSRLLDEPALAGRLAAAGRRRVEDFSWEHLAAEYSELYQQVSCRR
ncbi:MAG: glycosyltransferase family 4 protein [Actinobacteria bacterium]|nr:glycosyltransferase family 4 protein [Actinomycetota bacterium]